jgi:hypothetical protein
LFSGFILFFSSRIKKAFFRGMRYLRGQEEEQEDLAAPEQAEENR